MGVCVLVIGVSLLLSVVGTLAPLGYFGNRPVQIESLSASILWVCSLLGKTSLTYAHTFGSLNVLSSLSSSVTFLITVLLVIGPFLYLVVAMEGRIDLAMACLLTVLIVMVTGKVFSPQYLIWVIPLAAYVGQSNRWWLLFWTLVGLLTSWVYPYIYHMAHILQVPYTLLFYPVTAVRNFLLLGFIVFMLVSQSRIGYPLSHGKEQVETGKQSSQNPQQDLVKA